MQNPVPAEAVLPVAPATTSKPPAKKQGKQSKSRNQDKFRSRMNDQQMKSHISDIEKHFGITSRDADGQLSSVINAVQLTPQRRAIPLSITTRAVGVATTIAYDRAVSAWSQQSIADILTIHQMYRVHLWLVYLKLYLAQSIQVEPASLGGALHYIQIPDEHRELIRTVTEVPTTIVIILDSIGKLETDKNVYHSGITNAPVEADRLCEYWNLVQTPDNIRESLLYLADAANPVAHRNDYIMHNSIPGALFEEGILINADQVWPEDYGFPQLQADIHDYKTMITRAQVRLPKHSYSDVTWEPKANSSLLWSSERSNVRIDSTFYPLDRVRPVAAVNKRRRDAIGQPMEVDPAPPVDAPVRRYRSAAITSDRQEFWSRELTPHVI